MSTLMPITTPLRKFEGHENRVRAVAVFPNRQRMVTSSEDKTLRLWDLKTGEVLKKMKGHSSGVFGLAVSRDGRFIASGDWSGKVILWNGETGESLTQPMKAHSALIWSLDFSPDGTVLTTSSYDQTTKSWSTNLKTWRQQGDTIECGSDVYCVRYSPSGELLAIATSNNIQIYNTGTRERVASFKGHTSHNLTLTWTPDGTRLLTVGDKNVPCIREWDTLTWQQVGDPWAGHTKYIRGIAVNSAGTLAASASDDNHVRLWRLSDRRTVAIFQHSSETACVTFSVDDKCILSAGGDAKISEWAVPKNIYPKILAITIARDACITGDLSNAEELLTREIDADAKNHTFYAHRSFVMARKHDWDNALQDAIKSISIQPSLTGYISKGIALCGKGHIRDARAAFDVAFVYTDQDSHTNHFVLLIKAIALFNADQHEEANLLLKELAAGCPYADTRARRIVETYLRVQLGIKALDDARHDEAADHFTAAVNSGAFSSRSPVHFMYEDLVMLFGLDLRSLWLTAHQKRCQAFLSAGKHGEALESHKSMMDVIDETTKASCLDWSNDFAGKCIEIGGSALAAGDYDKAIDLYSAAINLTSPSDAIFSNRSKAKLGKRLWIEALFDAQKVIQLNPSSHVGYKLEHAAFHGAQRYDEAMAAFQTMLSKLDNAPDTETRKLRQQFLSPSEVDHAIRKVIDVQLENAPPCVLDTTIGLLCDREAQIRTFKTSTEYMELVSSTIIYPDIRMERIEEVVAMYFRYAMLSHRWEGKEPLLQDVQGKFVYQLDPVGGIAKLQSFCKTARDAGYRWAWSDTCCIDKNNNVELQKSVNSMFIWYHHSALTIVYLCDVLPSSQPGALAESVWNERGWTFQEFVAPKVVIFYQKDWSLYLDDRSPNHKESSAIMKELEGAMGIDTQALISFRPGMSDARQRLQWASSRVTTLPEDIAYSLFGIFRVHLPVIYGEKKQNAVGRLLQEIVAQSGNITVLDWVGQPSEFNSCLPAHITSYATPPRTLSSLSEDQIQTMVSSPRTNSMAVDLASKLYDKLDNTSAARFANCRLHLPCITFRVTEVSLSYGSPEKTHSIYEVKADGLHDLRITTKEPLVQFSRTRPTQQKFILVRPWDRSLLELPDFAALSDFGNNMESGGDYRTPPPPPSDDSSSGFQEVVDLESRALRLLVRLGQPFDAFLLARQRGGEYKRIASDRYIIAQVKDAVSEDLIRIKTIEIL